MLPQQWQLQWPSLPSAAAALAAISLLWLASRAYEWVWGRPLRLLRRLRQQGVPGCDFVPFFGQSRELRAAFHRHRSDPSLTWSSSALPFQDELGERLGRVYSLALGPMLRITIADPSLIRAAYISHGSELPKSWMLRSLTLFGQGLVTSFGELWSRQRRLINPAFNHREIKRMFATMAQSTEAALNKLEAKMAAAKGATSKKAGAGAQERATEGRGGGGGGGSAAAAAAIASSSDDVLIGAGMSRGGSEREEHEEEQEVEMSSVFASLTLDIIAATAFGASLDSLMGPHLMHRLLLAFSQYFQQLGSGIRRYSFVPGITYLPFPENMALWRSDAIIRSSMLRIIRHRKQQMRSSTGKQPAGSSSSLAAAAAAVASDAAAVHRPEAEANVDLLGLMLRATESAAAEAASTSPAPARPSTSTTSTTLMSDKQLMDECLTFLVAGHETTSNLLTWTILLLAQHPEWQHKLRGEVRAAVGIDSSRSKATTGSHHDDAVGGCIKGNVPAMNGDISSKASSTNEKVVAMPDSEFSGTSSTQADSGRATPMMPSYEQLSELRLMTMVLNESLRLYPPAAIISRSCEHDLQLSESLTVPAGVDIVIPVAHIHRRKDLWGEDAARFRPERFENGVARAAAHPLAFLPFSVGPRTCIGQNFAMVEAKAILAAMLLRFEWRLSPSYRHWPEIRLTMKPKHGMPVLMKRLT